jgi:DNA-binding transcriptional ArsR family regulator
MTDASTTQLKPTLWRTCRVLANRKRLEILSAVIREQEVTVSAVAQRTHCQPAVASQYLRMLNARGLISARRSGRLVYYSPVADPSVPDAAPLLEALHSELAPQIGPIDTVFRLVTAFTHPRRVTVTHILAIRPMTSRALSDASAISHAATIRHLRKLVNRGFVERDGDVYGLANPRNALAARLLGIATGRALGRNDSPGA